MKARFEMRNDFGHLESARARKSLEGIEIGDGRCRDHARTSHRKVLNGVLQHCTEMYDAAETVP